MTSLSVISRGKSSGRIPPSLLPLESESSSSDEFISLVSNVIDKEGLEIKSNDAAVRGFQLALKMAENASISDSAGSDGMKLLMQRRAILLAIVASTPSSSSSLQTILKNGYLSEVKKWLDDILSNSASSVDLLLHMLDNICALPVTKEMVTSSKLGKQVAAIEKHKICVGGKNESAIKDRVGKVKEMWSASVKRLKKSAHKETASVTSKRPLETDDNASNKKTKTETNGDRKSLLSGLIKKSAPQSTSNEKASVSLRENLMKEDISSIEKKPTALGALKSNPEKKKKSIKWADTNGGTLSQEQIDNGKEGHRRSTSSSERRKRDRMGEKELLQKARKSKLVDNGDSLDTMVMMFSSWHQPKPLPPDPENPPVQVESKEVSDQVRRMTSVLPVSYLSEEDVPHNPLPLSDREQAQEITSQAAAVPQAIPFFIPSQEPAPAVSAPPLQTPTVTPPAPNMVPPPSVPPPSLPPPIGPPGVASVETVKAMGLPLFLAGQNIQALQTLAASPGLLNAFVDANGAPDQARILTLVQTLTQNLPAANPPVPVPVNAPPPIPQTTYGQQYSAPPAATQFRAPPPPQSSIYGANQIQSSGMGSKGYRGDQNTTDGNLHLSGYGPNTTPESIIALFAPYVKVDEVVPKNGFMFVNTNDPEGAKRAREALSGVMLDGSPLRINVALRRNKNPAMMGGGDMSHNQRNNMKSEPVPLPRNVLGQIDYDNVRDDRGNPATKNLFVAGYGAGTSEQMLTDVFNKHCLVTGIAMKGSFSFVNTTERNAAVNAREALTGTVVNGGVLRINFAKESGRLGTSFDGGYGSANQSRNNAPEMPNYYGRSSYS